MVIEQAIHVNESGRTKAEQLAVDKERYATLEKAAHCLADVQIEMLREDEHRKKKDRTDDWRQFYALRCRLGELMQRFKIQRLDDK